MENVFWQESCPVWLSGVSSLTFVFCIFICVDFLYFSLYLHLPRNQRTVLSFILHQRSIRMDTGITYEEVSEDLVDHSSDQLSKENIGSIPMGSSIPFITWRMAVIGIVISLGGITFGYDTGQVSGFLAMESFKQHFGELDPSTGLYDFTAIRSGLLVGIVSGPDDIVSTWLTMRCEQLSIGNLCGALLVGPLADRLGRKLCISLACLVYSSGLIVQITATTEWYQLVIGRFIGGLGVGSLSILVSLYLSETSPTHNRGTVLW